MALFSRVDVINAMLKIGLVPVFYQGDVEKAKRIVDACLAGGARVLEFTNRGDLAYRVFCDLLEYATASESGAILGVGSVLDAPTASLYINSGANFVVGPNLNPEVARLCNRRKVAYSPGCGSVSEISDAEELGVEIVKIFPGGLVGGPAFVQAVTGPMPWTRLMPTGGVSPTEESVGAWIKAGAACLGIGSKLISKDLVTKEDWPGITQKVKNCLELIEQARSE
jgi:2-dehydro-3-deoxyphosphogluconate aldolase/(4S)-4-hydroxy-2-oxoglutarate aldolase